MLFARGIFVLFFFQVVKAQSLTYRGTQILFPLTVKETCQQNNLNFKPPGFYYKKLADSSLLFIDYVATMSDFYNERQAAHVLHDRQLTTYVFEFPNEPQSFKTETKTLEALIGKKFLVTQQSGSSSVNYPAEKREKMPNLGNFRLAEGKTQDGIVVFLREIPRLSYKQKPLLQVFFFKGVSSEKMKIRVHAMD